MERTELLARPVAVPRRRRWPEAVFWYVLLTLGGIVTAFPFLWTLLTSPNYARVWDTLPIPSFFANSIIAAVATTILNVLVASLAGYPLAKMRFPGRDLIFYLLLGTLIVPVQLTFIPSYVLAVNVFDYHDSLAALVLPNLASAFNIFLMRQAFRGVPDELIDAARVDGAREWRIWWQILMPIVRPSVAAVAIFTFVVSWNDFLWPSLMLPTMENKTLPVGLVALQGFFGSDFRAIAAGVTMTVVPILIFFIAVQRYFVRGLGGALKG
jgi:putative chitobiose transport system permease protein